MLVQKKGEDEHKKCWNLRHEDQCFKEDSKTDLIHPPKNCSHSLSFPCPVMMAIAAAAAAYRRLDGELIRAGEG